MTDKTPKKLPDGMHPWVVARAEKWTDRLEQARQTGDKPADEAVESVLGHLSAQERREQIKSILKLLTDYDFPIEGGQGPEADRSILTDLYVAIDHRMSPDDRIIPNDPAQMDEAYRRMQELFYEERFSVGRWVFRRHLLSCAMILACYSLPAAYAAHKGVRVLAGTGFLEFDPNRRLHETTKLVFLLMVPGGDTEESQAKTFLNAFRALRKIRVLHALVRRMLLDTGRWDTEKLGVPINQEDLAATLMTFSYLIIDGMRKIEEPIEPRGEQAYLEAWAYAGRFVGVEKDLIPVNVGQAEMLTKVIQYRQCDPTVPNADGVKLTAALLEFMEQSAPWFLRRFPAAAMRHFLPADVAEALGVPRRRILAHLLPWVFFMEKRFDRFRLMRKLNEGIYWQVNHAAEEAGRPVHNLPHYIAEELGLIDGKGASAVVTGLDEGGASGD